MFVYIRRPTVFLCVGGPNAKYTPLGPNSEERYCDGKKTARTTRSDLKIAEFNAAIFVEEHVVTDVRTSADVNTDVGLLFLWASLGSKTFVV